MKPKFYPYLLVLGIFFTNLFPQGSGNSAGFAVHNGPAILTAKFWVTDIYAIDFAGTFNFQDGSNWVHLHSDFLIHNFSTITIEEGHLPLYLGGGINTTFGTHNAMGFRVPFGASYIHKNFLFETFFEIAPFLDIITSTRFSLDGAIGFRLYL